ALEQQRRYELLPWNLAVLGVGGLFLVEDSPQAFEGLLADHPGDDPAHHTEGQKQDLGHRDVGSSSILRVSRGSMNGSSSGPWPASMCRPRSSSALNSAPSRIAILEIHSHTRKAIPPPSVPEV